MALSIFGRPTQEFEVLLLEVLFEIAAKLRFKPDCIQCWFRPEATSGEEHLRQSDDVPSKLRSNEKQFPLFCSLLDRVNHEGRAGEFARTGLLYLVELAAHSESFEKWVIESDLASLMASGLGALYSELSRYFLRIICRVAQLISIAILSLPTPRTWFLLSLLSPRSRACKLSSGSKRLHPSSFRAA